MVSLDFLLDLSFHVRECLENILGSGGLSDPLPFHKVNLLLQLSHPSLTFCDHFTSLGEHVLAALEPLRGKRRPPIRILAFFGVELLEGLYDIGTGNLGLVAGKVNGGRGSGGGGSDRFNLRDDGAELVYFPARSVGSEPGC